MSAAPAPARPEPPPLVVDAVSFAAATGASASVRADVEAYRELLEDWNTRMNLVGPSALAQFWPRHAYDSAQLTALAPEARTWADLGAGAGFPGIILAILLKGQSGAQVHLIDSLAKRCRFLEAVVEALSLPATVHNARAESLSLKVDRVTARACAPLPKLLAFAEPYLKKGAVGLFLKGQDLDAELIEAHKSWKFEASIFPSSSHSEGRILQVKGLARVRKS